MKSILADEVVSRTDLQRVSRGFMTVSELLDLSENANNVVLDPFSILVSRDVKIGRGNILYPNLIIETIEGGEISIGNGNVFFPASILLANAGKIIVGDENQFGDGGARIKANTSEVLIEIGSKGRYMNGAEVLGKCQLGSGTQILGAISVQNCILGAGDSYRDVDPETRGGVLKGFGLARNLIVHQGQVINGQGNFDQSRVEQQIAYHPKKS